MSFLTERDLSASIKNGRRHAFSARGLFHQNFFVLVQLLVQKSNVANKMANT